MHSQVMCYEDWTQKLQSSLMEPTSFDTVPALRWVDRCEVMARCRPGGSLLEP